MAEQDRISAKVLPETARWLEDVLAEAWKRMIPFPALPDFLPGSMAAVRLRWACVDSNEDSMTVLSVELGDNFGLDVRTVYLDAAPVRSSGETKSRWLTAELRDADVVVTTPFHAGAVRAAAGASQTPLMGRTGFFLARVELGDSFGLDVRPVYLDTLSVQASAAEIERLRTELRDADLVVATPFHAGCPFSCVNHFHESGGSSRGVLATRVDELG